MNLLIVRFPVAVFALAAPALRADVVFRHESAEPTQPWVLACAGGGLAASTLPASSAPQESPPVDIDGGDYFAQSLMGNGQHLKALAFYGSGQNSVPATYSISILDYGQVAKPVDTAREFSPKTPAKVAATATFVLGRTRPGRLIFEFKGDDSVLLEPDHAYVALIATEGSGKLRLHRMPNGTSYEDGACAKGVALNPSSFNSTGAGRDAVFALYTSVP